MKALIDDISINELSIILNRLTAVHENHGAREKGGLAKGGGGSRRFRS
jgi:hypothetical protein